MSKLCEVCKKNPWTIESIIETDDGTKTIKQCVSCWKKDKIKQAKEQDNLFTPHEMGGFDYE